jgi:hypothetical protein
MVMVTSSFMPQRSKRKYCYSTARLPFCSRDMMTGTIVFVGVVYEP